MENSIKEDIKILETLDYLLDDVYSTNLVNDEERNKYQYAIEHILSTYKRVLKENEEYKKFLEKTIKEYIPDYKLEELVNRYKNESFIPRVEVKKILEDRRK